VKFAPCLRHDLRQVYAMVYAGIATFLRQVRVLKIEGGNTTWREAFLSLCKGTSRIDSRKHT